MAQAFDYIIVGAGSAGGTLADLLTRDGKHSVLMIEAGGTHKDLMVDMPAGWGKMLYDKKYSWGYVTEPEPAIDNRRLKLPRGRVLGGCSSTNGLLYVRGHKLDFQDWVDAGATGWSWDELMPHFKATEDQHIINNDLHGKGGALTANALPFVHPSTVAMLKAAEQAG